MDATWRFVKNRMATPQDENPLSYGYFFKSAWQTHNLWIAKFLGYKYRFLPYAVNIARGVCNEVFQDLRRMMTISLPTPLFLLFSTLNTAHLLLLLYFLILHI